MTSHVIEVPDYDEFALARYWQNLSRRLQLSETPPLPLSSDRETVKGIPLEHPVSLSLKRLVDAKHVVEEPQALQAHAGGATYAGYLRRQLPGAAPRAIINPTNEQEIAAIMLWAAQRDIKILPWGYGTVPYDNKDVEEAPFIVIKLTLVNRHLSLDMRSHTITMQAGATWEAVEKIARQHDFVSGKACLHTPSTLGGSLAIDAINCRSPGYGTLADDIVTVRIITPSGPVNLRGPSSPTKNILDLFLSSRGTCGIITEVTFQLHPKPVKRVYVLANFTTRETAIAALEAISRHQHHLVAARLMDVDAIDFFGSQHDSQRTFTPRSLLNGSGPWKTRLLAEIAGSREAVSRTRRRIEEVLRQHDASIESNGRIAHLKDGLWGHHRPLWRELWQRGLIVHRLTTTVPWHILPRFLVAWEDALSSILLSTSDVPGLPLTTIHALKRHAQLDTLLLGHQVSGELGDKIEQLEAIQAVANELNWRWEVTSKSSFLVDKVLEAARRTLDPSNVMLH